MLGMYLYAGEMGIKQYHVCMPLVNNFAYFYVCLGVYVLYITMCERRGVYFGLFSLKLSLTLRRPVFGLLFV